MARRVRGATHPRTSFLKAVGAAPLSAFLIGAPLPRHSSSRQRHLCTSFYSRFMAPAQAGPLQDSAGAVISYRLTPARKIVVLHAFTLVSLHISIGEHQEEGDVSL
jgi:hypothetical protein